MVEVISYVKIYYLQVIEERRLLQLDEDYCLLLIHIQMKKH